VVERAVHSRDRERGGEDLLEVGIGPGEPEDLDERGRGQPVGA